MHMRIHESRQNIRSSDVNDLRGFRDFHAGTRSHRVDIAIADENYGIWYRISSGAIDENAIGHSEIIAHVEVGGNRVCGVLARYERLDDEKQDES
jgi:hypothetical protein